MRVHSRTTWGARGHAGQRTLTTEKRTDESTDEKDESTDEMDEKDELLILSSLTVPRLDRPP